MEKLQSSSFLFRNEQFLLKNRYLNCLNIFLTSMWCAMYRVFNITHRQCLNCRGNAGDVFPHRNLASPQYRSKASCLIPMQRPFFLFWFKSLDKRIWMNTLFSCLKSFHFNYVRLWLRKPPSIEYFTVLMDHLCRLCIKSNFLIYSIQVFVLISAIWVSISGG